MIATLKHYMACRRLARIVEANRKGAQDYAKRREAALRGWAMRLRRRSGVLRTEPEVVSAFRAPAAIAERTP